MIHIACAFDEGMALAGYALAQSIARQATALRPVTLHILHSGLNDRTIKFLSRSGNEQFTIKFYDVREAFSSLPTKPPYSREIFFRLCLPTLLYDISRVIYLDTDTIVLRDLGILFDTPIEHMPLAAVPDFGLYYFELMSFVPVGDRRKPVFVYLRDVLGIEYSGPDSYFNSGVMVLNLDVWRARNISGHCAEYIRSASYLQWPDQDALNIVCNKDFVPLDTRWNVMASCCVRESRFGPLSTLEKLQKIWSEDPWIIHFTGDNKPWRTDHNRTIHDHHFWRNAVNSSLHID